MERLPAWTCHRLAYSRSKIGRAHVELQTHVNLVCRLLLEKNKFARIGPRWSGFQRLASHEDCYMDQPPTRQIPDDELVDIADQPQLWISNYGYVKTLRAGL